MATELTPCGALFETMKRYGGISHKDLARLVLSGRPLADGKARCRVAMTVRGFHASSCMPPVGSLQDRYFCDWGVAALRVSARLRSRDGKGLSAEEALSLVTNQGGALMEQALRECHQDLALYRNVLERLKGGAGYSVEERPSWPWCCSWRRHAAQNVKRACAYARLREDGARRKAGNRSRCRYGPGRTARRGVRRPARGHRRWAFCAWWEAWFPGGCTGCSRFPMAWRSAHWPWGLTISTMWSSTCRAIICASGATRRADGACRAWEAPTAPC